MIILVQYAHKTDKIDNACVAITLLLFGAGERSHGEAELPPSKFLSHRKRNKEASDLVFLHICCIKRHYITRSMTKLYDFYQE